MKPYICDTCGKEFQKISNKVANSRIGTFCSHKCYTEYQEKHYSRTCPVCHKKFIPRGNSVTKIGFGNFCSSKCSGIYSAVHFGFKPIDIEIQLANGLTKRNIPHLTQYPISNIAVTDLYIPTHKIAIFIDGYWHNTSHAHRLDKDIEQTQELESLGYNVFRFSYANIKKQLTDCIKTLENFIDYSSNRTELKIDGLDPDNSLKGAASQQVTASRGR